MALWSSRCSALARYPKRPLVLRHGGRYSMQRVTAHGAAVSSTIHGG
ncbi:hypothetical protein VBJFXLJN_CDS_0061 [Pseudomonas phage TIVP-H6]